MALRCGGEVRGRERSILLGQSCATPSCKMDGQQRILKCLPLCPAHWVAVQLLQGRDTQSCPTMHRNESWQVQLHWKPGFHFCEAFTELQLELQAQALGRAAVTGELKRAFSDVPLVSSCFSTKHKAPLSPAVLILILIHFISLVAGRVKRALGVVLNS